MIRGSALVEMSGGFWLLLVQGEPKKESFTILSPLRKTFWVVGAMSPSVTWKENSFMQKQLSYSFEAKQHRAYIALLILASTSYSDLLCWLLFVSEEDVTELEGGFFIDIDE